MGEARIDLFQSARGPNSSRHCTHQIIFQSDNIPATSSDTFDDLWKLKVFALSPKSLFKSFSFILLHKYGLNIHVFFSFQRL
jgi:hypothetical protein